MKSLYMKLQKALILGALTFFAQGCAMELTKDTPGQPGSHPNPVTLTRKYQRVQRYTCAGVLRSDGIESVQSPQLAVAISPDSGEVLTSNSVSNPQNGDTADLTWDRVRFTIKYHTRDLGLKVERGLNIVDYTFRTCSSPVNAPAGSCAHEVELERGTVSFDVTYTEQTLAGISVITDPCPTPSASP